MTFLNFWVLSVFAIYFFVLIAIAIVRSRQMREMQDYVLGSRRLNAVTAALSASSSAVSSGSMLVVPALAFVDGGPTLLLAGSIFLGSVFSWTLLAKRLRRYTIAADNSLTISEFLERRFDDRTGILRSLVAIITLYFVTIYISSGLVGGFLAVSRTDVFQSLLMLASFTIIPAMLLHVTDYSVAGMVENGSAFLNPFNDTQGNALSWVYIASLPGWGISAWGSLRVLQRFMAIENEEKIPASRNIGVAWLFLITIFGLAIGWMARPALEQAAVLAAAADPEKVYFVVTEVFFHPLVAGVLLCGVVAAVMSTADSQLLLGSAVAADDLPVLRRVTNSFRQRPRIWLGRLLLVVIGLVSMAISMYKPDSILDLVSYAFGGMGAAFGPSILLALYWRRFNFWGAVSGVVVGTVVSSIWGFASGGPGGVWNIMVGTPGFAAGAVAAVAITLLTRAPSSEVVALFDNVNPPKLALTVNTNSRE